MASPFRLANEAWEMLHRAQATLAREFEHDGDWGDLLPTEYGVLHALSGSPDGRRMTDLCDNVLLTQPGVSRLVRRLEQRGLVARRSDEDDRRASRIVLTDAGAEVQRQSGRMLSRRIADAMTRALDEDQLRMLLELTGLLLASARRSESEQQGIADKEGMRR